MKTEKLELKHLAPYLPYGLNILCDYGENELLKQILCGCHSDDTIFDDEGEDFVITNVKPILHPLSDLTKEIDRNGEKFVPKTVLIEKFDLNIRYYGFEKGELLSASWPFGFFEKLFEWHFDVFNLIPSGLAIDINTL